MNLQDFMGLPIYFDEKSGGWIVFGTNRTIVLSELEKRDPQLYKSYIAGKGLARSVFGPTTIAGNAILSRTFKIYYTTFVSLEICSKYGIVITPYTENPLNF